MSILNTVDGRIDDSNADCDEIFDSTHQRDKQTENVFEVAFNIVMKNTNIISDHSIESSSNTAEATNEYCRLSSNCSNNSNMELTSSALTTYLVHLGSSLSKNDDEKEKQRKKKKKNKIRKISHVLNISQDELKYCKYTTDITKTCRAIIKLIYPDETERAEMLVTKIPKSKLQAIHEYARFVHHKPNISSHKLSNAIGNVFAATKHKKQKLTWAS
ncbi:unnamed protein product [Rotaria sp. Silwood2]|nr:unnamed protein product [Rotaria sp. Silwood2]CAF4705077.1 unnamed protein product [Rotaria sp. Silwood2]